MGKPQDKSSVDKSSFFQDVYEVVRLIPPGRVTSYGAIAHYLGTRGSARMVGWALNSSFGRDIPAHRVVNRIGVLTGKMYFGGNKTMQELLEEEGIIIKDNQIEHFDQIFWDPSRELL
jgi:methylated-DNA-protein-cysteine methyltransferase-like protein